MAVKVQCDPDLTVSETFARDFRMNAGSQQMRGVRVAQIVKPNTLQAVSFKEIGEGVREAVRLQWTSVRLCDDVAIIRQPDAKL